MAVNIHIDGITHIAGKYNTVCDSLSRRGLNHPSTVREHAVSLGLAAARVIDICGDKDVMALLELCRPQGDTQSDEEFITGRRLEQLWSPLSPASHHQLSPCPIPNAACYVPIY